MSDYLGKWAIHPGETLSDILSSYKMTQKQLSDRTGLTPKTINEIIKGNNPITVDTALKLSMVFGMSPDFWNNLQKNYEEIIARLEYEKSLTIQTEYVALFSCYSSLVKYEYLKSAKSLEEKAANLLKFLGIADFNLIDKNYQVAYRRTENTNLSKENLVAFLRCGEISAQRCCLDIEPYNKAKLENSLPELIKITQLEVEQYSKKFQKILTSCGVILVYTPYLKNTFVSGATRWLNSGNPLIQITQRHKREDAFIFSFFHELGHVLKHNKKIGYINLDSMQRSQMNDEYNKLENEADNFATNTLIKRVSWNKFIRAGHFTTASIVNFSKANNVSSSIVAGRLRFETKNYSKWGELIRSIDL